MNVAELYHDNDSLAIFLLDILGHSFNVTSIQCSWRRRLVDRGEILGAHVEYSSAQYADSDGGLVVGDL